MLVCGGLDAPLSRQLCLVVGNLFVVGDEVLQADLAVLVPVSLLELRIKVAAWGGTVGQGGVSRGGQGLYSK